MYSSNQEKKQGYYEGYKGNIVVTFIFHNWFSIAEGIQKWFNSSPEYTSYQE